MASESSFIEGRKKDCENSGRLEQEDGKGDKINIKNVLRCIFSGAMPQLSDLFATVDELIEYGKTDDDVEKEKRARKLRIRAKSLAATTAVLIIFATPAIVLHELLKNQMDSLHGIRTGLENLDKAAAAVDKSKLDSDHVIIYAAVLLAVTTLLVSWLARGCATKAAAVAEYTEPGKYNQEIEKVIKETNWFVEFGILGGHKNPHARDDNLSSFTNSTMGMFG